MREPDPLDDWLSLPRWRATPDIAAACLAGARLALVELPAAIDAGQLAESRMAMLRVAESVTLSVEEVLQAEALYRQVHATRGKGKNYVQEALLNLIAVSNHPASLPFWVALLDLQRSNDQFLRRRRTFALAALAYHAIKCQFDEAEDCLRRAAYHAHPDVRAEAIAYWRRIYQVAERPLPEPAAAALRAIAESDSAFCPRFQARATLRTFGLAVPNDNPGGLYAFKVNLVWAPAVSRVIAVRAEQTLDDLQRAIQEAFEWDNEHWYAFFMNGDEADDRYRYNCPMDAQRPPWTRDAVLGEIGLSKGHKFHYYFDYGDSHRFDVEVVEIWPANRVLPWATYPQIIGGQGEAPEQYP